MFFRNLVTSRRGPWERGWFPRLEWLAKSPSTIFLQMVMQCQIQLYPSLHDHLSFASHFLHDSDSLFRTVTTVFWSRTHLDNVRYGERAYLLSDNSLQIFSQLFWWHNSLVFQNCISINTYKIQFRNLVNYNITFEFAAVPPVRVARSSALICSKKRLVGAKRTIHYCCS